MLTTYCIVTNCHMSHISYPWTTAYKPQLGLTELKKLQILKWCAMDRVNFHLWYTLIPCTICSALQTDHAPSLRIGFSPKLAEVHFAGHLQLIGSHLTSPSWRKESHNAMQQTKWEKNTQVSIETCWYWMKN